MKLRLLIAVLLLSVATFAQSRLPATAQSSQPSRKMAVTIDDLSYVNLGRPNYLTNAQRITTEILRALKTHRAPAVG